MDEKKTHVETKEPRMTLRNLADYMAASEQAKRTVVRDCKYRPIARVVQHDEAKLAVSNYLRQGGNDPQSLITRAAYVRAKIAADDFENEVNLHNADYIARFAEVVGQVSLPDAEIAVGKALPFLTVHGVKLSFTPQLLLSRTTKTNKLKVGAVALRYSKGKPLKDVVGNLQSAAIHGYLQSVMEVDGTEAERQLCLTLDAYAGVTFSAPGNSVSIFNNMKAACATIAECWPNTKPPPKAVL